MNVCPTRHIATLLSPVSLNLVDRIEGEETSNRLFSQLHQPRLNHVALRLTKLRGKARYQNLS